MNECMNGMTRSAPPPLPIMHPNIAAAAAADYITNDC